MDKKYPKLSYLLKSRAKVEIFEAYKDRPDELLEAETLIHDLDRLGCRGLKNKFKDLGGADKFDPTISELKVAKILNNKYDVELLPDKDPRFIKESPDIICTTDTFTTYIEVARFNDSSIKDIVGLIEEQIGDFIKCLPYRIDIYLKEKLSIPKIKEKERNEQKKSVLNSLETFKRSFNEARQPKVPLNLLNDAGDFTFVLKETELEQGYVCILSDCFDVPAALIEYFEQKKWTKRVKHVIFPSSREKILLLLLFICI